VLDIGPYLAGDSGAARAPSPATSKTQGFSCLPITAYRLGLVEDTSAVAAQFFARPEADKLVTEFRTGHPFQQSG
jgi:hypothetical protein